MTWLEVFGFEVFAGAWTRLVSMVLIGCWGVSDVYVHIQAKARRQWRQRHKIDIHITISQISEWW
jgi:hypothetical protein